MSEKNETSSGVGGVPSGSRSEYGSIIPLRPRPATPPTRCLRGHRLDLGGMTATYHHRYRLHGILCEICRLVEQCNPPSQALAEWAYIDISVRHSADSGPAYGLVLVAEPPPRPGGTGHLHLRLDGATTATIDLALCGSCHRGTVHSVHVENGTGASATDAPSSPQVSCSNPPTLGPLSRNRELWQAGHSGPPPGFADHASRIAVPIPPSLSR